MPGASWTPSETHSTISGEELSWLKAAVEHMPQRACAEQNHPGQMPALGYNGSSDP